MSYVEQNLTYAGLGDSNRILGVMYIVQSLLDNAPNNQVGCIIQKGYTLYVNIQHPEPIIPPWKNVIFIYTIRKLRRKVLVDWYIVGMVLAIVYVCVLHYNVVV